MFSIFWPLNLAKGLLSLLLNGLVFLSCALTAMALMGDKGWLWSLTTHFRVQYLIIQALAFMYASFCYWQKNKPDGPRKIDQWVSLIVLSSFLGINLAAVLPYYLPQPERDTSQISSRPLKLMHINLFGNVNFNTQAVLEAVQVEQPDMIDFVEYTERWRQKLERSSVLKQYPYRLSGRGNMALYSKRPLVNARLVYAGRQPVANQANIIAKIWLNGHPVTILVAHPASPIRPSHLIWLQESFGTWIKERDKLGKNLVIVGDLNTSPWSVEFKNLIDQTGLRDSQLGFGIQPSWPMLLPLIGIRTESHWLTQILQIPIDHVLVSERLVITERHTGPFVGSDHLPVVVRLAVGPNHPLPPSRHSI